MQILPATPARMYKVDKSANILGTGTLDLYPVHFGILKGLATKLVYGSWGWGWKCHFNPA